MIMIQIGWIAVGIIVGMLISTVIVPPTRKNPVVPQPHDKDVYHTDTGCVKLKAVEVPCEGQPESLNLIASLTKK
jgi:hypothetical protein